MNNDSSIYIAGHNGLVGSALIRKLQTEGYTNLVTRSLEQLDLRNQAAVEQFFAYEKPEYVFLAAAKVGGIWANFNYPADFIYDNLMITSNIIHAARKFKVRKLLFLGSSCIYPKLCPQPIKEEYLMTGALEITNEPYAIAKIAGLELCKSYKRQYDCNFISAMPTNLYGINDNFDLENSHVIPALIAKMYRAHQENTEYVSLWGTGTALREFLFVDDLADALLFVMLNYDDLPHINIGTGIDVSIKELASLIQNIVGYKGKLFFDTRKPDGTPRKVLNTEKINNMGWKAKTSLEQGLRITINWYIQNQFPRKLIQNQSLRTPII